MSGACGASLVPACDSANAHMSGVSCTNHSGAEPIMQRAFISTIIGNHASSRRQKRCVSATRGSHRSRISAFNAPMQQHDGTPDAGHPEVCMTPSRPRGVNDAYLRLTRNDNVVYLHRYAHQHLTDAARPSPVQRSALKFFLCDINHLLVTLCGPIMHTRRRVMRRMWPERMRSRWNTSC